MTYGMEDEIRLTQRVQAERDALREERDKLQAFKDWTHAYLDAHGVPHHPPGTHGAEGCRIGDRMDWLMAQLANARALLARMWEWQGTCQELLPDGLADEVQAALAAGRGEGEGA